MKVLWILGAVAAVILCIEAGILLTESGPKTYPGGAGSPVVLATTTTQPATNQARAAASVALPAGYPSPLAPPRGSEVVSVSSRPDESGVDHFSLTASTPTDITALTVGVLKQLGGAGYLVQSQVTGQAPLGKGSTIQAKGPAGQVTWIIGNGAGDQSSGLPGTTMQVTIDGAGPNSANLAPGGGLTLPLEVPSGLAPLVQGTVTQVSVTDTNQGANPGVGVNVVAFRSGAPYQRFLEAKQVLVAAGFTLKPPGQPIDPKGKEFDVSASRGSAFVDVSVLTSSSAAQPTAESFSLTP